MDTTDRAITELNKALVSLKLAWDQTKKLDSLEAGDDGFARILARAKTAIAYGHCIVAHIACDTLERTEDDRECRLRV